MRMYSVKDGTTASSHSAPTKDFSFEASISRSFRIDFGERRRIVARSPDRVGVYERIEALLRVRAQFDVGRARILFQMIEPRRAGNGNDVVAFREQPGERQLRHGAIVFARDSRESVEQFQILRKILALETRHGEANVLRRQRGDIANGTWKKAARQRREGDEGDTHLLASVEDGDFGVP